MDFPLSSEYIIPDDHLLGVCKYRQKGCCKYIIYFESAGNFYCGKKVDDLKESLDTEVKKATGDNCEGLPHEA